MDQRLRQFANELQVESDPEICAAMIFWAGSIEARTPRIGRIRVLLWKGYAARFAELLAAERLVFEGFLVPSCI